MQKRRTGKSPVSHIGPGVSGDARLRFEPFPGDRRPRNLWCTLRRNFHPKRCPCPWFKSGSYKSRCCVLLIKIKRDAMYLIFVVKNNNTSKNKKPLDKVHIASRTVLKFNPFLKRSSGVDERQTNCFI